MYELTLTQCQFLPVEVYLRRSEDTSIIQFYLHRTNITHHTSYVHHTVIGKVKFFIVNSFQAERESEKNTNRGNEEEMEKGKKKRHKNTGRS